MMKQIINGRMYNTVTADLVADVSCGSDYRSDFRWDNTALYRTKKGAFFLAGEGGPLSRWSRRLGSGDCYSGCGIRAIGPDEAAQLCERYADLETYTTFFGEPVEA